MRNFIKKITHPFLKIGLNLFYLRPKKFTYNNIEVIVHPDVFPPHLTLSTKVLLNFISTLSLKDKSLLELGCGSGIIALYANKKGANVIASDINKTALDYLKNAALKNNLKVTCVYSNLFENLSSYKFDYIIINPPYYPKNATIIKEQSWFCGDNFEYFKDLFKQLPNYILPKNNIFMILSVDCNITKIKSLAKTNNLVLNCILEKSMAFEKNFIFRITTLSK